jgi:hypothetical protein
MYSSLVEATLAQLLSDVVHEELLVPGHELHVAVQQQINVWPCCFDRLGFEGFKANENLVKFS